MEITQITETLYALPVPIDAINIARGGLHLFYDTEKDNKRVCIKNNFGFRFEIIGTVTQEEIDFNCEPYIHKTLKGKFYNYSKLPADWFENFTTPEPSFRSLLSSKGINPTPETKLLIIEKV